MRFGSRDPANKQINERNEVNLNSQIHLQITFIQLQQVTRFGVSLRKYRKWRKSTFVATSNFKCFGFLPGFFEKVAVTVYLLHFLSVNYY